MASRKNPAAQAPSALGNVVAFIATSVVAGIVAAGLLVPPAAATGLAANASIGWFKDLPAQMEAGPMSRASTVVARDGTEIATFYAQNRTPVSLDEMSPHMSAAILAIEDRDFYEHGGVDLGGILRALGNNIIRPDARQGASTITQQYVNNLLIDSQVRAGEEATTIGADKGYTDKIKEIKLALSMEQELSKDEILEGYLNMVLFGGQNYGVEAAAQYYWGIPASDLSISQSAVLAGMVQSPNYYDPAANPEAATERRNIVLDTMLTTGAITQEEHATAAAEPIEVDPNPTNSGCTAAEIAPYFCDYVENSILQDSAFGETPEERLKTLQLGGLTITTTLDVEAQRVAEESVNETQPRDDNPDNVSTALVSLEPTNGDIVAMAQNTYYSTGEGSSNTTYNFNVDSWMGGAGGFQVGSTYKPLTYAAWIDAGNGAEDEIDATRTKWPADHRWKASCLERGYKIEPGNNGEGFEIQNAESGYTREMEADFGLYNSINTAIYAMAEDLDLCDIGEISESLGIVNGKNGEPVDTTVLASLLGGSVDISPMTMARAYSAFANRGEMCEPRALERVVDYTGKEYDIPETSCERVISEDVADGVNFALNQTLIRGSGWQREIGLPGASAAKTGTTDNSTQTWMIGYTRGLATASWVGNYEFGSRSLNGLSIGGERTEGDDWVDGSTYAGGQWQRFMEEVARDYDTDEFEEPSDRVLEGRNGTSEPG
ncbi:transglycosylase domain-containing protein [Kocuria rosea]|uniref:transglycosylase domain-containing protein n=1 Tax=Kocuria rosea TaxID=1275 RepID=UPI00119EF679|nr:transglycosylase domain-containing protein [Kocuria rosea]WJZ67490.1 transglycosylase domain-containing protein [Kocuria rosea]